MHVSRLAADIDCKVERVALISGETAYVGVLSQEFDANAVINAFAVVRAAGCQV